MEKKLLVTGGAGFIGSNLIDLIAAKSPEWTIRVIDDFSSGLEENIRSSSVEITRGSILNTTKLDLAARGVDSIIHLAAIGSVPRSISAPRATHDANVTGTLNVLEAARQNNVQQVIVASSSSVYSSNPSLPRTEFDWTRPLSPYAASKLATESYANAYGKSYGMENLAFRFFNVYGPRQRADHPYAAVIPKFISAAVSGHQLQIFGDGNQSRDFTYVDSVCEAIYIACQYRVTCVHPVNLAFGTRTSLNELIATLEKNLGHELDVEHLDARIGDVRESQADTNLLDSMFPLLRPTPLDEGLNRTIQWYLGLS